MPAAATPTSMKNASSISIVICTYNRGDILRETLDSYATMTGAFDAGVELLVVDNNSTDQTREITTSFVESHAGVRYVFERQTGLSYARNTGIKEARGDIIAFVDDDVYFDTDWLQAVRGVFACRPDADCMGGKSIPTFDCGRPDWLSDDFLGYYGSTNSGDMEKWMVYPEHPYGLNMAFRRNVFETAGAFDPKLGRIKTNLLSGEESDLFWRIDKAGLKVRYEPAAVIYHRIPASRTKQDWLLSRHYWQGISDVCFEQLKSPKARLHLISSLFNDIAALGRASIGRDWSPRKAYWHFKALRYPQYCYIARIRGRVRQTWLEVLGL
jgi:glycosyltransferase involved in cell wall biosynthesis